MKNSVKKPVGDQPIASAREIRRIDPVWSPGPVPKRFWEVAENRRNYVLWLSHKLGCRKMKHLYRLSYGDAARNHGAGVATNYWRASIIVGIIECFPDFDWQEWLFRQNLKSFWKDKRNQRRYMQWLAQQLQISIPEGWYRATTDDFERFRGASFLVGFYRDSVSRAVKAYLPDYDWKEWLFNQTPKNFWKSRDNRTRYMRWLAEVLGIAQPDDWYRVTCKDFFRHSGRELLKLYGNSTAMAVMDLIPRQDWCEWRFHCVPGGFWRKAENRRRYMQWLGKQLNFRRAEDWLRVRRRHFTDHCGGGLLAEFDSHVRLLREYLPQLDYNSFRTRRN